jgi:hypothetical protein
MLLLQTTVLKAMEDLIPTLLLVGIALLCFAVGMNVLFGGGCEQWSQIPLAVVWLLSMIRQPALMDTSVAMQTDLSREILDRPILSVFLFFAYTMVFKMVLLNLQTAVILGAYENTKAQTYTDKSMQEDNQYLKDSKWPSINPVVYAKQLARFARQVISIQTVKSNVNRLNKEGVKKSQGCGKRVMNVARKMERGVGDIVKEAKKEVSAVKQEGYEQLEKAEQRVERVAEKAAGKVGQCARDAANTDYKKKIKEQRAKLKSAKCNVYAF